MALLTLSLAALVVAIFAVAFALDCRADRDVALAEANCALAARDQERALKVEALLQLRTVRHRACAVCRAADSYIDRSAIRPAS